MISFRKFLRIFLNVKHRVIADNFDTANLPRTKGTFLRYRDTGKPQSSIRLSANYAKTVCTALSELAWSTLNIYPQLLLQKGIPVLSIDKCASRACIFSQFFRGTCSFMNTPFPPKRSFSYLLVIFRVK